MQPTYIIRFFKVRHRGRYSDGSQSTFWPFGCAYFDIANIDTQNGTQILIVVFEPDASRWPYGEKATDQFKPLRLFNVWRQLPEAASQILIV
ncbi:hypothetical protein VTI28DRAFT_7777 [Corynascus sepedonium]